MKDEYEVPEVRSVGILNFASVKPSRLEDLPWARHQFKNRKNSLSSFSCIEAPVTACIIVKRIIAEVANELPKPCIANVCAGSFLMRQGLAAPGMSRSGLR